MLSRIADSLYWMSRYLERADGTARLLEINLTHLLEAEDALPEAAEWKPLLVICGYESAWAELAGGREANGPRVTEFMTREPRNPGSIRASLRLARENARVVRDRISKEMWEGLNELWLRSEERLERPPDPEYYRWLRSEVARFHGLTVSTMMRGEAFGFYLLGFFLERADMTCRLLDVKYHLLLPDLTLVGSPLDYYQWAALLRSLSGFEAYRRKHHQLRPIDVADFVILDPDFPRSLRFAVDRMQQALIGIGASETRSGALALVAELTRRLEKSDADGLFQRGLHEFLAELLVQLSALHEALREEYFEAHLGNTTCGS
jgi:uncharacterized alpha-E superfamily protein